MDEAESKELFRGCAMQITERFCQGFNACLLAYGQTGSGKVRWPVCVCCVCVLHVCVACVCECVWRVVASSVRKSVGLIACLHVQASN